MKTLNLPRAHLRLKNENGSDMVFDNIRKKFVKLTPEEWVRQHFVHYLIDVLNYPKSLINLETGLKYNLKLKRTDIVVYNREMRPFMIVECKAPEVKLNQKVFDQVAIYNATLKATYLVATNGLLHICAKIDHKKNSFAFLKGMPEFDKKQ